MGDETEGVMQYCFSDSLCKVVVLSDKNHLYSYMLEENVEEVSKLKGTVLKENI